MTAWPANPFTGNAQNREIHRQEVDLWLPGAGQGVGEVTLEGTSLLSGGWNVLELEVLVAQPAMAPHSSALAWKIPWAEEPGGLQSRGLLESDTTERLHFHISLSCI